MIRRRLVLLAAVVAAASAGIADDSEGGPKPRARAPYFTCPVLVEPGGAPRSVSLREQLDQGHVVVLSFFNTNCQPCIREIPRLTEAVKPYLEKGVVAYLVCVGVEDDDTIRAFIKKHGFTLPVLSDREGLRLGERYGVVVDGAAHVPRVVVIGRGGTILASWKGFSEGLEAKLDGQLAKAVTEEKAVAGADGVTLLFTNNTNGLVKPAPGSDLGGLGRRATVVKRIRAAGAPVVLVDSGDFLPVAPEDPRARQVVAAYRAIGYDAVTIGEEDFVEGLKFLRDLVAAKDIPFITANLKACKDEECVDLARSAVLVNAGKRRVAVFGYMHPEAVGFTPSKRMKDGSWKIKIVDHVPLIKGFIQRYRQEADLLVVLSHAGVDLDRKLAETVPGIDIIVGGHSQTFMSEPVRVGDTLIVQAASDGQYVGKLVMRFAGGKPLLDGFEMIPLGKGVAEDAGVLEAMAVTGASASAR